MLKIDVSPNVDHVALLQQCKASQGFKGRVMNLFSKTIKVVNEQNETVYYHKGDLLNKLCQAANLSTINAYDRTDLSRLLVENLHPVKGIAVTIQKVQGIFADIGAAFKDKPATAEALKDKFEALKIRHLKVMTYDVKTLKEELKIGDLFFKKNPANSNAVVVRAQYVFRNCNLSKMEDIEAYKYSHVAMYVGNGEVAEAVTGQGGGVQLRLIKLEDSRFALDAEEKELSYVISRPANEELAHKAAAVARATTKVVIPLEEKQSNKHPHKYAFLNAARSLWHFSTFGLFAKQRYFKQYIDSKRNDGPRNFLVPKNFFCSNFVGFCYQTAESLTVIPKIVGEGSKPSKAHTGFGRAICRDVWARYKRWQSIKQLDQQVQMKYDAKWLTPLDYRNFVVTNPHLFNDKLFVTNAPIANL